MDEILVNNFMVFNDVVDETYYDLVIGDEAWDVDYFLHENPELKRFAFAWMTDFVGWLPMPERRGCRSRPHRRLQRRDDRAAGALPAPARPLDLRRQPRRRRRRVVRPGPARHPRVDRTRTTTSPATSRGSRRPTEDGARPTARDASASARTTCSASSPSAAPGSGDALLRRVMDAVPLARRLRPELRFLRGDAVPGSIRRPCRAGAGRRCAASCPTSTSPSPRATSPSCRAGSRRAWSSPPRSARSSTSRCENHFEQNFHVRHRLDELRRRALHPLCGGSDPEALAAALVAELVRVTCTTDPSRPTARRARPRMLAELI